MMNGKGLALLCSEMQKTIDEMKDEEDASFFTSTLASAIEEFQHITRPLTAAVSANARTGLANATLYLDYTGHIVMAWMHLRILKATLSSQRPEAFLKGKWQSAKYFYSRELSRNKEWANILRRNDQSAADMRNEWF